MSKINIRVLLAVGVILLVVIAFTYYTSMIQEISPYPQTVRIVMTTFDWGFNVTSIPNFQDGKIYPNNPTITVHVGQRVQIELRTLDITHGFAIDAFNVQAYVPPGQLVTVTFVPTQTGNFTYYCNTFCGLGHPYMHGILQVLA